MFSSKNSAAAAAQNGGADAGSAAGRSSTSSASNAAAVSALFPPGSVFTDGHPLPRLVVFDLDYTLWPFWVDTHVSPPMKVAATAGAPQPTGRRARLSAGGGAGTATPNEGHTTVVDRFGETFAFYGDVPDILHALPASGVRMGVASRTSAPDLARDLLRLLQVPAPVAKDRRKDKDKDRTRKAIEVFDAGLEVYPTTKIRHMEALHKRTGIPYEEFLFFDDESRNRNVETLGVTMFLVRDGVNWDAVERGVRAWRRRRGVGPRGTPQEAEEDDMAW